MSSVDRSGRNSHTDQLRSQREEYQEREAELVNRQKAEQRRQSQNQAKEIERIKSSYETYIRDLKDTNSNSINERDRDHQEDIAKVRGLYAGQLRKKVEDSEIRVKTQTETNEAELSKRSQIEKQQRDLSAQAFRDTTREKEEAYSSMADRNRLEMQEALKRRTEQLNLRHGKEVNALSKERDAVLTDANLTVTKARSDYDHVRKQSEQSKGVQMERLEDRYEDNLQEQSRKTDAALKVRDADLREARKHMQTKFSKAIENKNGEMDQAREDLVTKTNERMDNQMRSLRLEASNHKANRFQEFNSNNRVHDLEKKNIMSAYEDRMSKLLDEKNGSIQIQKQLADKRISKADRINSSIINDINLENHRDKMLDAERRREDRTLLEMEHKRDQILTKNKTDDRVDKVLKASFESQDVQARNYNENLSQMRASYAENLMTQRQAQLEQMKDTYLRMEQRLLDSENKSMAKSEKTVEAYENKIKQIENKYAAEMKKKEELAQKQMGVQKKGHYAEVKTQEAKFDVKLSQLEDAHQKEIDRLEKRHHEQMAGLADRLNYYRRKS